jgi:hypothetical protein
LYPAEYRRRCARAGTSESGSSATRPVCGLDDVGGMVMVIAGQSSFPALGGNDQVKISDSPQVDREGSVISTVAGAEARRTPPQRLSVPLAVAATPWNPVEPR